MTINRRSAATLGVGGGGGGFRGARGWPLNPFKHLEGSLGVGTCGARNDQHMQTLARDSQFSGKAGLVAATAERFCNGRRKLIPVRSVDPGAQGLAARETFRRS